MVGKLHFMGTPLTSSQNELTQKQWIFLELACIDYVNDEREFQVRLHGGKVSNSNGSVRDKGLSKLKDPRKIKPKKE